MKKCNLCYDRTSQGLQPWCAQACPTQAIWYGDYEEFVNQREGRAVDVTVFGSQSVRTKNYHVVPEDEPRLDITLLLLEAENEVAATSAAGEEAWVL
jgi:Fe-S-cluster-containing dehydrogenase component